MSVLAERLQYFLACWLDCLLFTKNTIIIADLGPFCQKC